jgi:hypothetical protein
VNQQDQQAIDELFQHLYQTAQQAGPRDGAAEALIQRYIQQAPPGLLYQMAQMLVAQQHTLNQVRAQQQSGAPAGFAPPQGAGYQSYGQPRYQQPANYQQPVGNYQQPGYQQPGRQGGGFLAGAGKLALGVGGGIVGAEVLTNIFDGGGGLFGGDRDRDRDQYQDAYQQGFAAGDQQGFAAGDDYRDRDDYQGQDPGGFDNGGFDDGGFDPGDNGGIF